MTKKGIIIKQNCKKIKFQEYERWKHNIHNIWLNCSLKTFIYQMLLLKRLGLRFLYSFYMIFLSTKMCLKKWLKQNKDHLKHSISNFHDIYKIKIKIQTRWCMGTAVRVPNLPLMRPTISCTWLVSFWSETNNNRWINI